MIDDQNDFLDLDLKFDEGSNPGLGITLPQEQRLRPFYFVKLISESITNGVFLSSELYVHKQIWEQKQIQIAHIDQKLHLFKELRKEFGKVRINRQKNVVNAKHVENLVGACLQIQAQFESVVDFNQSKSCASHQTQQSDRSHS